MSAGRAGGWTSRPRVYIEDDYRRPRSPIDRIKSLFGGAPSSAKKPTGSTYGSNSSRYTGSAAPPSQFKRYGAGWF